jgi:predicted secreted protein
MPFDRTETVITYNKHLSYSDTLNGSYTNVAGTIDIQLPQRELGVAEITNDDTADYTKDYIPALFEPGTIPFTYRYTKSQFASLETIFQARTAKYWKVLLADGSYGKVTGFIVKHDLPLEGEEDSPVVEGEIQATGKMAWTSFGSGS